MSQPDERFTLQQATERVDEFLSVMRGRPYQSYEDRQALIAIMLSAGSHKEVTWLAAAAVERLLELEEAE